MSDDDIIERGGTQEDIDAYAHDVGGACGAVHVGNIRPPQKWAQYHLRER